MFLFKGRKSTGDIVILGITEANVEHLRHGHPLHLFLQQIGINLEVAIHYGKDEESLGEDFIKVGIVTKEALKQALENVKNFKPN